MDNAITFTPAELVAFITAIGGAILTIGGVVALIVNLVKKVRAPEVKQDARLDALEKENKEFREELKSLDARLRSGDDHFKEIELSTNITLRSIHALLKHALNGDALKDLQDAEDDLNKYLFEGRTTK